MTYKITFTDHITNEAVVEYMMEQQKAIDYTIGKIEENTRLTANIMFDNKCVFYGSILCYKHYST